MKLHTEEKAQSIEIVRPLGRVTARAISSEEAAQVCAGMSSGISNCGGFGDRDLVN